MAVAKLDSKGRLSLPKDMREMLGEVIELQTVGTGKVMLVRAKKSKHHASAKKAEAENFRKLLNKEPRRRGKPENPTPQEMKSIWNE